MPSVMSAHTSVRVEPDSFEMSGYDSIIGRIWLQIEGREFPETDWFDFPVVILRWWLSELAAVVSSGEGLAELRFMDGPLTFKVQVSSPTSATATGDLNGTSVLLVEDLDPTKLYAQTRAAASVVVKACMTAGWDTQDVVDLRRALE